MFVCLSIFLRFFAANRCELYICVLSCLMCCCILWVLSGIVNIALEKKEKVALLFVIFFVCFFFFFLFSVFFCFFVLHVYYILVILFSITKTRLIKYIENFITKN